jgi:hypothetical protein
MSPAFALTLALCVVAAFALLRFGLLLWTWHVSVKNDRRGWRLRLTTPGRWAYEEKRELGWEGIPFEEITEINEAPFVIIAPSVETWRTFPSWAYGRRMEILGRVRSELTVRRYVIEGLEDPEGEPGSELSGFKRLS